MLWKNKSYITICSTVVVSVLVNIVLHSLVDYFNLPLYLNTLGTIFTAATCGYLPALFVAFFTDLVGAIGNPIMLYHGSIQIIIALSAGMLSRMGFFKKPWKILVSITSFAIVGGCLWFLVDFIITGFHLANTATTTLAQSFMDKGLSFVSAELIANFIYNFADKVIIMVPLTIVLRLLPNRILKIYPFGYLYAKANGHYVPIKRTHHLFVDFHSLKIRIIGGVAVMLSALGILATVVGTTIYQNSLFSLLTDEANNVLNTCSSVVDPDEIHGYLILGDQTASYIETENELSAIRTNFADIVDYVYVYKIESDGVHVIFDIDTPTTQGEELGTVIDFEKAFIPYVDTLIEGGTIPPLTTNDTYGWLYTVYRPIFTSDGLYAAHIGVDIGMTTIMREIYPFVIEMISVVFAVVIIFIAIAMSYFQKTLVDPLSKLAKAMTSYVDNIDAKNSAETIRQLDIHSRDEIEALYKAIFQTTEGIDLYITEINRQNKYIGTLQDNIIVSFAEMVENRDATTGSHVYRTALYVQTIAEEMLKEGSYPNLLTESFVKEITKSAPLHDIGKIKIPDSILDKPGKLTPEERKIMETHTTEGAAIIASALQGIEGTNYLTTAQDIAQSHHEWFNGNGYPNHLAGQDILISARIMAVADVYDALVSKRPYKDPFPVSMAAAIIKEGSGIQFDPLVVQAFFAALETITKVTNAEANEVVSLAKEKLSN